MKRGETTMNGKDTKRWNLVDLMNRFRELDKKFGFKKQHWILKLTDKKILFYWTENGKEEEIGYLDLVNQEMNMHFVSSKQEMEYWATFAYYSNHSEEIKEFGKEKSHV